jgi:ArsR family transcriptional regulator
VSNNRNNIGQLAEMFKALSNPHRLKILQRLADCCPPGTRWDDNEQMGTCVGELGNGLGIAPSTLSHHIKELRQAGIIRSERRGQNIECMIDPEIIQALAQYFSDLAPVAK